MTLSGEYCEGEVGLSLLFLLSLSLLLLCCWNYRCRCCYCFYHFFLSVLDDVCRTKPWVAFQWGIVWRLLCRQFYCNAFFAVNHFDWSDGPILFSPVWLFTLEGYWWISLSLFRFSFLVLINGKGREKRGNRRGRRLSLCWEDWFVRLNFKCNLPSCSILTAFCGALPVLTHSAPNITFWRQHSCLWKIYLNAQISI